MFENVIKGGIKPGMILITDHPTRLDTCNRWIVFPNNNYEMCAVCYGECNWAHIRQEADKLYLGSYQCTGIFAPPTSYLCANSDLIWSSSKGLVKIDYKPNSSDLDLEDLLSLWLDDDPNVTNNVAPKVEEPKYFY